MGYLDWRDEQDPSDRAAVVADCVEGAAGETERSRGSRLNDHMANAAAANPAGASTHYRAALERIAALPRPSKGGGLKKARQIARVALSTKENH